MGDLKREAEEDARHRHQYLEERVPPLDLEGLDEGQRAVLSAICYEEY